MCLGRLSGPNWKHKHLDLLNLTYISLLAVLELCFSSQPRPRGRKKPEAVGQFGLRNMK